MGVAPEWGIWWCLPAASFSSRRRCCLCWRQAAVPGCIPAIPSTASTDSHRSVELGTHIKGLGHNARHASLLEQDFRNAGCWQGSEYKLMQHSCACLPWMEPSPRNLLQHSSPLT